MDNWGFFIIYDGDKPVAGAITAYDTPDINMLNGRDDMTVLWDIRIHPDYRGQSLGRQLIEYIKRWAVKRDCVVLKIETQNINVNACRFYHAMGAKLDGIQRHAYPGEESHEIMFLWYIDL